MKDETTEQVSANPTNIEENRPYNPLQESVSVKPYTNLNVDAPPERLAQPIPEATFQKNVISANERLYNTVSDEMGGSGAGGNAGGAFNPMAGGGQQNQVNKEDTEMAAKQLAKVVVDSYEGLHMLANRGLQFSERKLKTLQKEGAIDLSIEVPYDLSGRTMPAGEFIEELNKSNRDVLSVSPQFKKEVTPVLTRVFEKRGVGMTDEHMLLYLFGKDIAMKGALFFQVKATMNDYLEQLKDLTEAYRTGQVPGAPQPSPSPAPQPVAPVVTMQPATHAVVDNFSDNEAFQHQTVIKHTIPETGKDRAIRQKQADKRLASAAAKAQEQNQVKTDNTDVQQEGKLTYEKMRQAKKTGKAGRKQKSVKNPADYVQEVNEEAIAAALKLTPTTDNTGDSNNTDTDTDTDTDSTI